jgi:hypothetical protein
MQAFTPLLHLVQHLPDKLDPVHDNKVEPRLGLHPHAAGLVVQGPPRYRVQAPAPGEPDQPRAGDEGLRRHGDAGQAEPAREPGRHLQARRPPVPLGVERRVVEQQDRVRLLLHGQHRADVRVERGEDDAAAGPGVGVRHGEDGVEEVVDFRCQGVDLEGDCFIEQRIFWRDYCQMGRGERDRACSY